MLIRVSEVKRSEWFHCFDLTYIACSMLSNIFSILMPLPPTPTHKFRYISSRVEQRSVLLSIYTILRVSFFPAAFVSFFPAAFVLSSFSLYFYLSLLHTHAHAHIYTYIYVQILYIFTALLYYLSNSLLLHWLAARRAARQLFWTLRNKCPQWQVLPTPLNNSRIMTVSLTTDGLSTYLMTRY